MQLRCGIIQKKMGVHISLFCKSSIILKLFSERQKSEYKHFFKESGINNN